MKFLRQQAAFIVAILITIPGIVRGQRTDCGVAWDNPLLLSVDSVYVTSPQVAANLDTLHAFWWAFDYLGTGGQDGIQYSRSTDGGVTFSLPVTIEPSLIAVNPAQISVDHGNIYLAFDAAIDTFQGTALVRSTDGGLTWQPLQRLRSRVSTQVISSYNSQVYLAYSNPVNHIYGILRSTDNGATWQQVNSNAPHLTSMVASSGKLHGAASLGTTITDVYYYESTNGGTSWSFPQALSSEDVTPSEHGRLAWDGGNELYAVWNDTNAILLSRSRNLGESWLPQERISNETGAESPEVSASDEFVTVVWNNQVNNVGTVHARSSNDYAFTFCPSEMLTPDSGAANPNVVISHTALHSVWLQQTGDFTSKIVYRHGTLTKNVDFFPPKNYALEQNFPNPFNGSTHIQYEIPTSVGTTTHVTLEVYNLLGQLVTTLVDNDLGPGRYDAVFEGTYLSSGVYFFQLRTAQFVERKKLILLR